MESHGRNCSIVLGNAIGVGPDHFGWAKLSEGALFSFFDINKTFARNHSLNAINGLFLNSSYIFAFL